jgi:hypothetical protein
MVPVSVTASFEVIEAEVVCRSTRVQHGSIGVSSGPANGNRFGDHVPRNRSRGSEPRVSRFAAILVLTLAAACSGSHLGPTAGALDEDAGSCPVTATLYGRPPSDPNPLYPKLGSGPWYINADRTIWATVGSEGFRQGGNKVMWVRPAGPQLIVTGQRLDASAGPLSADIPCCYPSTFQASGLTFPTPGCWQVTAKAGTRELQFVALVRGGP